MKDRRELPGEFQNENQPVEIRRINEKLLSSPQLTHELETEYEHKLKEKDQQLAMAEEQLEGFGRMAVERDILLRELESMKLMRNDESSNVEKSGFLKMEKYKSELEEALRLYKIKEEELGNELQSRDLRLIEMEKQLEGFGKLAVELDILTREMESLRWLMKTRMKKYKD